MNILLIILPIVITTLVAITGWLFLQVLSLLAKVAVLESLTSNFMANQIKHNDKVDEKLDEIKDCLHD